MPSQVSEVRNESFMLEQYVKMPKVPNAFLKSYLVNKALCLVIDGFTAEEQTVIYLYCVGKQPISEIVNLTELTFPHVISILMLYSEKLAFKIDIFKKALSYDANELVSVGEMLELESMSGLRVV